MPSLLPRSTIAKKLVNGVTGLLLFLFIIFHLSANLLLLANDPDLFNSWVHFLRGFGPLVDAAEIGLGLVFLYHAIAGLMVYFGKRAARKQRYAAAGSAGKPSKKTLASRTMAVTGIVLLAFLVWHVASFRFGPGEAQGYVTTLPDGEEVHDLYRVVVEAFSNLWVVGAYVAVMLLLGFHLRHGFWSMFQTLGAYHPRWTALFYSLGIAVGLVFAVGFLIIPIWVYVSYA